MNKKVTLLTIRGTPIKAKPLVLGNVIALWGLMAWVGCGLHPNRPWMVCLATGFMAMVMLLIADLGHAVAHIWSAYLAGAPMDVLLISMGMPRTLYSDNDVPPSAHRIRAIGGPIFNAAGLLVSLIFLAIAPRESITWEIAGWSSLGHGAIFIGSLAPLPIVDGGVLLKWTLVERGRSPSQADEIVRKVDLAIGLAAGLIGLVLLGLQLWIAGLVTLGAGAIAIGAYLGKIR